VSYRKTDEATLIETDHAAGSRLLKHAHSAPHLAILLNGAYFERIEGQCFLRLPGDEVFYPEFLAHENRFGRLPATCLNIETCDGSIPEAPSVKRLGTAPLERVLDLARKGKLRSTSAAAQEAGYHPVYFSRMFRKAYSVSVGAFLKNCRIRRSAGFIFRSDLSLAEIALETGYYDQSHLTNELATATGFTPGELRRLADE
jgi:AraC-like DNA-binding protein